MKQAFYNADSQTHADDQYDYGQVIHSTLNWFAPGSVIRANYYYKGTKTPGMSLNTWQTCLKHLERELPAEDLNTWIRPLQLKSSAGRSVLLAPNEYVRDYISLHHLEKNQGHF